MEMMGRRGKGRKRTKGGEGGGARGGGGGKRGRGEGGRARGGGEGGGKERSSPHQYLRRALATNFA